MITFMRQNGNRVMVKRVIPTPGLKLTHPLRTGTFEVVEVDLERNQMSVRPTLHQLRKARRPEQVPIALSWICHEEKAALDKNADIG